jgi:TRAP-type C4-dicarboxylate transport system substrate-binding protein
MKGAVMGGFLKVVATLCSVTWLVSSQVALAQTKWDLAAAYAPGNFHTKLLNEFAAEVDKASSGKLKITVHAAASLFKAPEIKRAVQGGQAQAGEVLLVNFQNENQIFGVDGIPFLADSYDSALKLWKAQKPVLEKKLAEQGIILLYSVPWPPQGIYAKKPINSAADLKGIKWRAYSPATGRIAELVGAQPVTVQAAELSQAMATGVIEATMTSGATGVDTKMWEQMKFYFDVQAWLPKNAVLINKKAFDALDADSKRAVLKVASDVEARGWVESRKVMTETTNALKTNGMTVAPPSAALKADMQKVGATMLQEWLKNAGQDGQEVINAFRK